MIVNFFDKLAGHLVENGTIEFEDKELYTYGLQEGFLIILNVLTTLFVGIIFQMVWQSIIFMVAYIPLRTYAGGYHARTQLRCYILSVLLTAGVLLTIKLIPWTNFIIFGSAFAAGLIIFFLAPVEDSNKPLDDLEVTIYKSWTRKILFAEIIILILSAIFRLQQISACITIVLCILSIMLVLGKQKLRMS